ncbi:DNA ligase 1, partial [Bienertia sinuspersici]
SSINFDKSGLKVDCTLHKRKEMEEKSPVGVRSLGSLTDKLVALSTTCYKGALIVLRRWIPNSSLVDYDFSWATMWVRVKGLPLHINQVHVAANLLERFGSVVYFDEKVKTEGTQKAIRARIRMQLRGALIPGCYLELEQGKTKWNDLIINENLIMPVYSRKLCGLKGTLGNKTTSVNLLLMTHTVKLKDLSKTLYYEEDDNDDDEEGGVDDSWSDQSKNNGEELSSKRPPSYCSSNSSDPSSEFGRPSTKEEGVEKGDRQSLVQPARALYKA